MSTRDGFLNQVGVPLNPLAQDEEGGLDTGTIERVQDARRPHRIWAIIEGERNRSRRQSSGEYANATSRHSASLTSGRE